MGSESRQRPAYGPRCYAAYIALGLIIAIVTLATMMLILWCYVGLVTFQLVENQRRAIVDYPFTTSKPSQLVANSSSPNRAFQDSREPYGAQTASNNISKSPTVTTMMTANRGLSRGESAIEIDKRKLPANSRAGDLAKGDFAARDRSNGANKTLGLSTDEKDNSTSIISSDRPTTNHGPSHSSPGIRVDGTRKPNSPGSSAISSGQSVRDDPGDERIHPRRVLDPSNENRPVEPSGSGRRYQDGSDDGPVISPSRVDDRSEERRFRNPDVVERDYQEEGRSAPKNYDNKDDVSKSRRSDTEYSRDTSRRPLSRDDSEGEARLPRPKYDDDDDDRPIRNRYDRVRDSDERERNIRVEKRIYDDDNLRPLARDNSRRELDSSRDDRNKDDRDRSRDSRYKNDRRRDDDRVYDERDRTRSSDDRRRDDDRVYDERDRTRTSDDRRREYRRRDDDPDDEGRLKPRDRDDRYDGYSSRDDERFRSDEESKYRSNADRSSDRKYDEDDLTPPRVRSRTREEDERYRSSGEERLDDRDYRDYRDSSRSRDSVDRKSSVIRSSDDRRFDDRTERISPRGEVISSRSDSSLRPSRPDERYVDRDDYRRPSRDYESVERIAPTRTREDTHPAKSASGVSSRDDRREEDYEVDRRERLKFIPRDSDTPVLVRPKSSIEEDDRYKDRDDDYRRPSRYDHDDRIVPSRVREESYKPRSTSTESRYRDDPRYEDRDVRARDVKYDNSKDTRTRIDDDDYRRRDDSRSSRRPVDEDRRPSDREEVVLDRRSYASEVDDEYRMRNRPPSRSSYDYSDSRTRDRDDDDTKYIRRGSKEDEDYRPKPRGDYGNDRERSRDRDDDKVPPRHDRNDDRSDRSRIDDSPSRKYDRSEDRIRSRGDIARDSRTKPLDEPEFPSRSSDRSYADDRDTRDRTPPIPVRTDSRLSRDRDDDFSPPTSPEREPSRVAIREKRFQNTNSNKPLRGDSSEASIESESSSNVETNRQLSAKDVIEAEMRQSHGSSEDAEVIYPVLDPRVSNMPSPGVIRPGDRRGTTINVKKKK